MSDETAEVLAPDDEAPETEVAEAEAPEADDDKPARGKKAAVAKPVAVVHPDNPEQRVDGHRVVKHPSGPLDGYYVATGEDAEGNPTW